MPAPLMSGRTKIKTQGYIIANPWKWLRLEINRENEKIVEISTKIKVGALIKSIKLISFKLEDSWKIERKQKLPISKIKV